MYKYLIVIEFIGYVLWFSFYQFAWFTSVDGVPPFMHAPPLAPARHVSQPVVRPGQPPMRLAPPTSNQGFVVRDQQPRHPNAPHSSPMISSQQAPPIQSQRPPMQSQRPPMQPQRPPIQSQRPPLSQGAPPIQASATAQQRQPLPQRPAMPAGGPQTGQNGQPRGQGAPVLRQGGPSVGQSGSSVPQGGPAMGISPTSLPALNQPPSGQQFRYLEYIFQNISMNLCSD